MEMIILKLKQWVIRSTLAIHQIVFLIRLITLKSCRSGLGQSRFSQDCLEWVSKNSQVVPGLIAQGRDAFEFSCPYIANSDTFLSRLLVTLKLASLTVFEMGRGLTIVRFEVGPFV